MTIDRKAGPMDIPETEIWQKEEDLKARCASSGENAGRMIPLAESDEWKVGCPACGHWWHGGSTALADQDRP